MPVVAPCCVALCCAYAYTWPVPERATQTFLSTLPQVPDADVAVPDVSGDVSVPEASVDVSVPDVDAKLPEVSGELSAPDVSVPSISGDASAAAPSIDAKIPSVDVSGKSCFRVGWESRRV